MGVHLVVWSEMMLATRQAAWKASSLAYSVVGSTVASKGWTMDF